MNNLPKTPPEDLIISMCIRYDHGLGCPGYYDSEIFSHNGITHQSRLNSTKATMYQLYEEVSGHGFYKWKDDRHPDDIAVDNFAAAMKEKLAKKREQGYGGWQDKTLCDNLHLSISLKTHVIKGDPVDVGNLAMMIHQRGEKIFE